MHCVVLRHLLRPCVFAKCNIALEFSLGDLWQGLRPSHLNATIDVGMVRFQKVEAMERLEGRDDWARERRHQEVMRRGAELKTVASQINLQWNDMATYCLPTTSPFMQSRARRQPERDSYIYTAGLPDTLISGGRTEIDFCADGSHRQDQDLNLVSLDFSSSSRPHQVEVMANLALNRSLVGRLGKESRIGFRSRQSYGRENSISQPSTTMEYQIPLAPPNKGTASLYWDSIRYTELMGHWVCKLNPRFFFATEL